MEEKSVAEKSEEASCVERGGKSWMGTLCGAHEKKETERNERPKRERTRERRMDAEEAER